MAALQSRVTIVVTQRESFVHTRRSLESLYATTRAPFSLVYVDGGSPALTRMYLKREAKTRGFTLVRRKGFLTPNEARNIGFSLVRSELVAFVENDVLFRDGWLDTLMDSIDQGPAVVGPLIYFREPAFSIVHSAGGIQRFDTTPAGKSFSHIQRHESIPKAERGRPLAQAVVDFVEFHCFLARTDVVRSCGPFDEELKTCCEFDDFFLTVAAADKVVVNEPAAVVQHLLPLPPPRGFGDLRFLKTRWSPNDNAASVRHFCRKWNVTQDDPFLRGVVAWCDSRPYTIVAKTRVYRVLRTLKRALRTLNLLPQLRPGTAPSK